MNDTTITILDRLSLNDGKLVTTVTGDEVHLRQGDADGACGSYCIFMALIIIGKLDRSTVISLDWVDKRTKLGRFFRDLENASKSALFREGTWKEELIGAAQNLGAFPLICDNPNKQKDLIEFIKQEINKGHPVIFGVHGKDIDHWLLAVGYSSSEIFVLDPSGSSPQSSYWNGYVTTVANGSYYQYCSGGNSINVRYCEAFALTFEE